MIVLLVFLSLTCSSTEAYYTLKQLSYTKLPASTRNDFKLFSDTAQEGAFDYKQSILYVIGQNSHLLHVVDILDPSNPVLLFSHAFTVGEGTPRSVAFCTEHNAPTGELAVSLSSVYPTFEGHLRFFQPYQRSVGGNTLVLDGYIVVGPYPDHIKYTPDCGSLVVANKGKPGKDYAGKYIDPPATISIVHGEKTGNPSVQHVDFDFFNNRTDIRSPAKSIPLSVLPTRTPLAQDLEPECVAVSADNRKAYVTLQTNDAIATIDISSGLVTALNPLPRKSWDNVPIDASDRDGGVHRRVYKNLVGIRQPGVIKVLTVGRNNFLFTADEGHTRVYTRASQTFDWTDDSVARTLSTQIETFTNEGQTLKTAAGNDEFLGRLHVSNVDGKDVFTKKFQHLEAFGGRGFSIWDATDLSSPVFDSAGSLEEYMEAFDKSAFNTDCVGSSAATYQSPENLRDSVSDNMGPKINALDVAEDNGTTFLAVGSEPTGFLFFYTIDTSSGTPVPQFQSVLRSGMKDLPWADLYLNGTAAGDGYISDIGIITSDKSPIDQPLMYVISEGTGSVSLYQIIDQHPTVPGKR